MKILITSGISAGETGGPAAYSKGLYDEFTKLGHRVRFASFGTIEKKLPIGIRHLYFMSRIFPSVVWADVVIALDTFSVGLPSVTAAKVFGKKSIVRVSGDFLWETHTNGGSIQTLPDFYIHPPILTKKEKLIQKGMSWMIHNAEFLAFNTLWQSRIWKDAYGIKEKNIHIVHNVIPDRQSSDQSASFKFLWAGRDIPLKNLALMNKVFGDVKKIHPDVELEIVTRVSHEELLKKMAFAYAVVQPSISDVCPNFILEAASFGKPFIMTKETGIQEILPGGGIFIDPLKPEELQAAIETMLDPEAYNRYRQEIERTYKPRSWREVANDFLHILS